MLWRVLIVVLLLASGCREKSHPPPPRGAVYRVVRTPDGWQIPIYRMPPAKPSSLPPVILHHGMGANRHSLDIDEEHSLARALQRAGRDVWLADTRATGNAQGPDMDFDFDRLAADAGLMIEEIRRATGRDLVDWVGHSMGGLVLLAHVGRMGGAPLRAVVILGSPVDFRFLKGNLIEAFASMRGLFSLFGRMPVKQALWAGRPFLDYDLGPMVLGDLTHNPDNLSREVFERVVDRALDDVSGGVLAQSSKWVECGCFQGSDGFDYLSALGAMRARLLVIAGARDRIAPPDAVRPIYERASSKEKEFFLAGTESGLEVDYGHGDLVVGTRAPKEIFPRVVEFLGRE